jgi:hypothetical protein
MEVRSLGGCLEGDTQTPALLLPLFLSSYHKLSSFLGQVLLACFAAIPQSQKTQVQLTRNSPRELEIPWVKTVNWRYCALNDIICITEITFLSSIVLCECGMILWLMCVATSPLFPHFLFQFNLLTLELIGYLWCLCYAHKNMLIPAPYWIAHCLVFLFDNDEICVRTYVLTWSPL